MAPNIKQVVAKILEIRSKKAKEEGMNQREHEKKTLTDFPGKGTQAFKAKFGFIEAQRHFDLLATGINENDIPCLI
jgi:hypothetical protein